MESIMTSIELQDNFTGVVYGIINAVNQSIMAMAESIQEITEK